MAAKKQTAQQPKKQDKKQGMKQSTVRKSARVLSNNKRASNASRNADSSGVQSGMTATYNAHNAQDWKHPESNVRTEFPSPERDVQYNASQRKAVIDLWLQMCKTGLKSAQGSQSTDPPAATTSQSAPVAGQQEAGGRHENVLDEYKLKADRRSNKVNVWTSGTTGLVWEEPKPLADEELAFDPRWKHHTDGLVDRAIENWEQEKEREPSPDPDDTDVAMDVLQTSRPHTAMGSIISSRKTARGGVRKSARGKKGTTTRYDHF